VSEELTYDKAINELESILGALESSAVDVDELSSRLSRAAELVRFCKDRLTVVNTDVEEVLEDLSAVTEEAADA